MSDEHPLCNHLARFGGNRHCGSGDLKVMKNAVYFTLKAHLVLKIFQFLS